MTEKSLATLHRKTDLPSKDVCSLFEVSENIAAVFHSCLRGNSC